MPAPIPVVVKSQNVCWSCRVRKQRCDKSLPSCSRCASKLIHCIYAQTDVGHQVQRCSSPTPVHRPSLLVRPCPDCIDLTSNGARELLQAASSKSDSAYAASLIGEVFESARLTMNDILDEYYATIHPWLPIIDQELFRTRLFLLPHSGDVEVVTLLWALFLVTRKPCMSDAHSMRSILYQTVRQVFMLEAAAGATLELLQAGLLITCYACGHGFPRDAHMTLATCATIARLMGGDFEEDMSSPPGFDDQHSVCRWAVVLLDRTVALSSMTDPMPLALPLSPNSHAACLESVLDANGPYRSFDVSSRVALLVGAALGYANDPRPVRLAGSTYGDIYNRMEELVRKIVITTNDGLNVYTYCDSSALAVIAHLALQIVNPGGVHAGVDSKENMLLRSTLRMVRDHFRTTTSMLQQGHIKGMSATQGLSVVALCALSRAAAIAVRLCGTELAADELYDLRLNLQRFGSRWTVGRIYLGYIDEFLRS